MRPTSESTPPTRLSISSPSIVWRCMIFHSSSSSGPVLVDDLLRHRDLADVMEEGGELDVAALAKVEPERVGDAEREFDHAAAVAAGVGVVGLDHVAEQHRRALVRLAQLERLVDPRLALAARGPRARRRAGSRAGRRAGPSEIAATVASRPIGARAPSRA